VGFIARTQPDLITFPQELSNVEIGAKVRSGGGVGSLRMRAPPRRAHASCGMGRGRVAVRALPLARVDQRPRTLGAQPARARTLTMDTLRCGGGARRGAARRQVSENLVEEISKFKKEIKFIYEEMNRPYYKSNAKNDPCGAKLEQFYHTAYNDMEVLEQNKKDALAMYKELSREYGEEDLKPDEFLTQIHQVPGRGSPARPSHRPTQRTDPAPRAAPHPGTCAHPLPSAARAAQPRPLPGHRPDAPGGPRSSEAGTGAPRPRAV
jgi:hypothetical protein